MARRTKEHDPESTMRAGMSTEASGVDAGETMASTGDEERAFEEIAAGTATGLGIDRGEATGTGGLASGEDRDEVAEGDYWRQSFRSEPPTAADQSAERFDLQGERIGGSRERISIPGTGDGYSGVYPRNPRGPLARQRSASREAPSARRA